MRRLVTGLAVLAALAVPVPAYASPVPNLTRPEAAEVVTFSLDALLLPIPSQVGPCPRRYDRPNIRICRVAGERVWVREMRDGSHIVWVMGRRVEI